MDNYEVKKKKIVRHVTSTKAKVIAVIIGIAIMGALCFLGFMGVSRWYDENKVIFQSPILIKFQAPVRIEKRTTPVKKVSVVTEKPLVKVLEPVINTNADYERAYDKVWLMESGRGTNKGGLNGYCIAKGMINEIGYAPHENFCFKDREEQKKTFMLWLTNRLNHVKMPWCDTIDDCIFAYSSGGYKLSDN